MNFLKKISICCGIGFGIMFILIFISTIFNFFDLFGIKIMNFLYMFIPIISCFISGIFMGIKSLKKGYLEGLYLGILMVVIFFLLNYLGFDNGLNLKSSIFYFIIIATCVLGSMIGINKKKEE